MSTPLEVHFAATDPNGAVLEHRVVQLEGEPLPALLAAFSAFHKEVQVLHGVHIDGEVTPEIREMFSRDGYEPRPGTGLHATAMGATEEQAIRYARHYTGSWPELFYSTIALALSARSYGFPGAVARYRAEWAPAPDTISPGAPDSLTVYLAAVDVHGAPLVRETWQVGGDVFQGVLELQRSFASRVTTAVPAAVGFGAALTEEYALHRAREYHRPTERVSWSATRTAEVSEHRYPAGSKFRMHFTGVPVQM